MSFDAPTHPATAARASDDANHAPRLPALAIVWRWCSVHGMALRLSRAFVAPTAVGTRHCARCRAGSQKKYRRRMCAESLRDRRSRRGVELDAMAIAVATARRYATMLVGQPATKPTRRRARRAASRAPHAAYRSSALTARVSLRRRREVVVRTRVMMDR